MHTLQDCLPTGYQARMSNSSLAANYFHRWLELLIHTEVGSPQNPKSRYANYSMFLVPIWTVGPSDKDI
jgi:hypothetical protein